MTRRQAQSPAAYLVSALVMALTIESVVGVITVQIGGANRLTSLTRQRDRYNCYWDCDLVGCQIARDDDECAYDCEKICRIRYDWNARSGEQSELKPKSGNIEATPESNEVVPELLKEGTPVRLHLPRNVTARNFAIWERCSSDSSTGKMVEKPFNV